MVVIVARVVSGDRTQLLVAPVTHREPNPGEGVEIPAPVKRHLGLDEARSWIITTEINRFNWIGPDIRIVPGGEDPFYGAIPAALFEKVRSSIMANARRFRSTNRTE